MKRSYEFCFSWRRTSWVFSPRRWSSLAAILCATLFAVLGSWQLQRAGEKEAISAARELAEQRPAILLTSMTLPDSTKVAVPLAETQPDERQTAARLHLQKIEVRCRLDWRRQWLLDNLSYRQRVGYAVLTPCHFADGGVLLVNRGWLAAAPRREQLPDVAPPDTSLAVAAADGMVLLEGVFAVPGEGLRLGPALDPGQAQAPNQWPKRIQYYDYAAMASVLQQPLLPGVFLLAANSPLGYTYYWQPTAFGPEKHYAYALQWFSFLGVLLVLYIALNTHRLGGIGPRSDNTQQ